MVEVINVIRRFSEVSRLSKHEQIVEGILMSIEDQVVERGQILPSINQMSSELGFARKTVDRAYGELKDRGLVESRNRRGFFVSTDSIEQTLRVALVMYEFRPFQEVFYNAFRQSVGENVQVDTFFHHNNLSVFEDIVTKIAGRYGLCVVAPIIDPKTSEILSQLIPSRLLIVDRFVEMEQPVARVIQEFDSSTFGILQSLKDRIGQYRKIKLFIDEGPTSAHPQDILKACRRFSLENNLRLEVSNHYRPGEVEQGILYLTVGDNDLWTLLEDCIDRDFKLGRDVGILSHNESRIKKLVHGGISTWSADFSRMAELAARFVLERQAERITVPTLFIDRHSF